MGKMDEEGEGEGGEEEETEDVGDDAKAKVGHD